MQKKIIIATFLALLTPAIANASCESVIEEIKQKIINNGVPEDNFTLVSVHNDDDSSESGTVVGNCLNETYKIIYTKK